MKLRVKTPTESVEYDWNILHILALIHAYGLITDHNWPRTINQLCRRMRHKPDYGDTLKQWGSLMRLKPGHIAGFQIFTDRLEITLTV